MQSVVQCTPYVHLDSQFPVKFFQFFISSQILKPTTTNSITFLGL